MKSVKPPRARAGILPVLALLAFLLGVEECGYIEVNFVPVGLSIDVLGAIVLAAPDVPQLRRNLVSGRLESAKQTLDFGWGFRNLASPTLDEDHLYSSADTRGFPELQNLLSDRESDADVRWENACVFTTEKVGRTFPRPVMKVLSESANQLGGLHWHKVTFDIDQEIKKMDGRVRRLGISILILGFGVQFLAYL